MTRKNDADLPANNDKISINQKHLQVLMTEVFRSTNKLNPQIMRCFFFFFFWETFRFWVDPGVVLVLSFISDLKLFSRSFVLILTPIILPQFSISCFFGFPEKATFSYAAIAYIKEAFILSWGCFLCLFILSEWNEG